MFRPHTEIVDALRKYHNTPIPVDYLEQVLGQSRTVLDQYLATLVDEGVVHRVGNMVMLQEDTQDPYAATTKKHSPRVK